MKPAEPVMRRVLVFCDINLFDWWHLCGASRFSRFWSSTLSRQHQPAAGLIPHRPIIDGQKLLADTLGNGAKTCAGVDGEDEAFHRQRRLI